MKEFLEVLTQIKRHHPTLRIGQLIMNAMDYNAHLDRKESMFDREDLWEIEDDEFVDVLKNYLKQVG